jgi:hypothetical protein
MRSRSCDECEAHELLLDFIVCRDQAKIVMPTHVRVGLNFVGAYCGTQRVCCDTLCAPVMTMLSSPRPMHYPDACTNNINRRPRGFHAR